MYFRLGNGLSIKSSDPDTICFTTNVFKCVDEGQSLFAQVRDWWTSVLSVWPSDCYLSIKCILMPGVKAFYHGLLLTNLFSTPETERTAVMTTGCHELWHELPTRKTWLALSLSVESSGLSTGVWLVNLESNWLASSADCWRNKPVSKSLGEDKRKLLRKKVCSPGKA